MSEDHILLARYLSGIVRFASAIPSAFPEFDRKSFSSREPTDEACFVTWMTLT